MTRPGKTLAYGDKGDFAALDRMRQEMGAAGFALGSSQRGTPTGVMHGDYAVAKWRNLNREHRQGLHGVVEGDNRDGPLLVTIFDDAPRSARFAFEGMIAARMRAAYQADQVTPPAASPDHTPLIADLCGPMGRGR